MRNQEPPDTTMLRVSAEIRDRLAHAAAAGNTTMKTLGETALEGYLLTPVVSRLRLAVMASERNTSIPDLIAAAIVRYTEERP